MPTTKTTATAARATSAGFSDEERLAMQARVRELKSPSAEGDERAAGEAEIRAKLAEMPPKDRAMGERIHELVTASAPHLVPRTYYGMPAYARDGRTICFFKPASKFRVRYATLGFQPDAQLDDGEMWPVEYALTELTPAAEARIATLVKQAAR